MNFRFLSWSVVCAGLMLLSGCSFGVMFSKMLTGDPTFPAQFRQMTGTDLTKGKHRVVVICSVPAAVDEDLSSLNIDLIEGVTQRMRVQGIDVVNADAVARWIDDSGGVVTDPNAIAKHFDVDYVAWIDLQSFSLREENSPHLMRGRVQGYIRVFKVEEINHERTALCNYNSEFTTIYPLHQPVSEIGRSPLLFQSEFVKRVCDQLGEQFYDHRPVNDI